MIYQLPLTPEVRQRLVFAETISIDLSRAPEVKEVLASAAEAHLHIELLHSVIKSGDLRVATKLMADWEASQC